MATQRAAGTGSVYRRNGSSVWQVAYWNGKRDEMGEKIIVRESSHETSKKRANDFLNARIASVREGNYRGPEHVTVADLYQRLLADYEMNARASLRITRLRWECNGQPGRLQKHFGGLKANEVTSDVLNAYVLRCQEDKLSAGTINRDLAALKRAFNIGYRSTPRLVREVPRFPHLHESVPRKGFVEDGQYRKLCENCKGPKELWLRAMLATAYTFGFRRGELVNMKCEQVDIVDGTIRLWRGTTKSGEPRLVKMTSEVKMLLQACVLGKRPEDYVFDRGDGRPILDFRCVWERLCNAAGLPGLLFHDLRRSAVRNMIRRGVPERVAMSISGHRTRHIFDRYNIVSESDLIEAARKIESGVNTQSYAQFDAQSANQLQVTTANA